ncbi:pro-melanin-concentrating hormone, like [Megalops cyprinoides]|uniref:pro-melanin-concentrating hormone, like n=1 Tax=Megalops cyprinoides TaxID=118141 RepID=UPI001864AAB8|nr:pro-melanin-concentrating hormone, like [Megalops cyprinoides]
MKVSSFSVLFAMALLSECYINSAAMPATKTEDASSEQDVLSPFLSDEVAENAFSPAKASNHANRGGNSKIIIVADAGIWKSNRALGRGLSLYKLQDLEAVLPPENVLTMESREPDQDPSSSISIARRDTMRCMVGRVYRPCWEV